MNRRDYRAAFDAVDFSADFEERTLQKLSAVRQASEKEQIIMPMNRVKKYCSRQMLSESLELLILMKNGHVREEDII